ncbi:MAG: spore photoproduct lyase family protein [Bacillota bacterium]
MAVQHKRKWGSSIFQPERVYLERDALAYPLGKKIYQRFSGEKVDLRFVDKHNRVRGLPGDNPRDRFFAAKNARDVYEQIKELLEPLIERLFPSGYLDYLV